MDAASLRDAKSRQPFTPFVPRLVDGRSLPVKHPDFLAMGPSGRPIIVFGEKGGSSFVESLLVLSIEFAGTNVGEQSASAPE
jgi:hypothetical protein